MISIWTEFSVPTPEMAKNGPLKKHCIFNGVSHYRLTGTAYSDNYKILLEIIEEMTMLNMKLIKEEDVR